MPDGKLMFPFPSFERQEPKFNINTYRYGITFCRIVENKNG